MDRQRLKLHIRRATFGKFGLHLFGCAPDWGPDVAGFGKKIAVMMLAALALTGVTGSPASALSRTGVALPGRGSVLAPPDPCQPQPQILSFTTTPSPVVLGDDVTLNWNVQVPNGCNYLVALLGQSVAPQGSLQVQPSFTTSYTLTLSWGPTRALWTTATTTASVDLPADPQDPTRKLVTIPSQQVVPLFVQALNTPNTTVVVNADLELSGLNPIVIRDGVRMVGWRTAVPGQPFLAGPQLSTTSFTDPLFSIQGDNVRISGVRLEGPYMQANTRGIQSNSQVNIEIDHNEINGWSAVGVDVRDPLGRIVVPVSVDYGTTPAQLVYASDTEPVWIHDNYIHDNYVGDPYLGYGVCVGENAHALIERNVLTGTTMPSPVTGVLTLVTERIETSSWQITTETSRRSTCTASVAIRSVGTPAVTWRSATIPFCSRGGQISTCGARRHTAPSWSPTCLPLGLSATR